MTSPETRPEESVEDREARLRESIDPAKNTEAREEEGKGKGKVVDMLEEAVVNSAEEARKEAEEEELKKAREEAEKS